MPERLIQQRRSPRSRLLHFLFAAACVFIAASRGFTATELDGRSNNPFGVQMGISPAHSSDFCSINWRWASDLVGEWGYVRIESGVIQDDPGMALRALVFCRANKLIPVFRGLYVPPEYRDPRGKDAAPLPRNDDYPLGAERYRRWAAALADAAAQPPYYEVGNEVNGKWDPEIYGHYLLAVSRALKGELPSIKIVSAGLAGHGADFIDAMLTAVPEVADHVDCWGLHPYGANHPPAYDKDGCCLKGHLWTAEALAKHGIHNPRFLMTESNYEIGNHNDRRYPRITDELRARYMVEAFETIWTPDPRVVGLCYFFLHSTTYPGWDNDVLVQRDGTKTRTYDALAAVKKPRGSDWMAGDAAQVTARVTDADTGRPVPNAFVYTVPGLYAAETDHEGGCTLRELPRGAYEVHCFRDGFVLRSPATVELAESDSRACALTMTRTGILARDMVGEGPIVDGWSAAEAAPDDAYAVDPTVGRTRPGSQRLEARPGHTVGIWKCTGYDTAVPDRHYAAELWVRGRGVRRGTGKGITVTFSVTDPFAVPLSSAAMQVALEGDFDWTPVALTIAPCPVGRRLRLDASVDASSGTVWLDDPYIHYADYPVPSRATLGLGTGSGVVFGEVMAETETRLPAAVVVASPGNFWSAARSDGTYELASLPAGDYTLHAFCAGWEAAEPQFVSMASGGRIERDIVLPRPPAPAELKNQGFEESPSRASVVPGWTRYGEFDGVAPAGWHPELPEHPEGVQPRSGEAFAGSIASYQTKSGGIRQTLEVTSGSEYEAGVWIYAYQTPDGLAGDVTSRLGLDPSGGTDPAGPYVIWTPGRPSQASWSHVALAATPHADRMTIFLDVNHVQGLGFVLNIFDDVSFGPFMER